MRPQEFSGGGAMLARLVDLGARAGLTATQTLLHVLDGAPLEMPPAPVVVRTAPGRDAHVSNYPDGPLVFGSDIESEETHAAEPIAADGFAYGLSAADLDPVAEVTDGSDAALAEPDALREFIDTPKTELLAKAVDAEPLRRRTQLRHTRRGRGVEGQSKTQAAIELYGTTALSIAAIAERIGSTPGAVTAYVKVAVRDQNLLALVGDAARGRVRQTRGSRALPEPSMAAAPALTFGTDVADGEGGRADPGPDVSPERAIECAERDAGPGTVRQDQPTLDAPAEPDTADRPAGLGHYRDDAADAGGSTRQRILDLFSTTTLRPSEIARKVGKSYGHVSGCISTARAKGDRRAVDGDMARKAVTTMAGIAKSVQTPAAGGALAEASRAEPQATASDPATVLTIAGNRIEGPTGGLDGFPLVARILAALADGLERHCDDVALIAEARSGAAVMAVLGQWAKDLASIGVAVVIGNDGCILLRKAVP